MGGSSTTGILVSGVPVESLPSAQDFIARYKARYPGPDEQLRTFDDYGYEAARIAIAALRKAGPDRAKILEAIRTEPHPTMLGDVIFDAEGDSVKSMITMTRADAKNHTFEPVIYER